jgi:hypothetical protein
VTDLSILTREAIDRIRTNPDFAIEVIKTLYPRTDTTKIPIIGGKVIPKDDIWDIINKGKREQTRRFFTVGVTGIIARKDK